MIPIFEFVQSRRKDLGLTQKELADKAGLSLYVIKRFEANKSYNPKISKVIRLAKELGVRTDYLVEDCEWSK